MKVKKSKKVFAVIVILFSLTILYSGSASAEVTTVDADSSAVDGTTDDRVDDIVLTLRIIAGVVLVATIGFYWHTRPSRRLQAAIDRGEVDGSPHKSRKSRYSFHFNIPDDESSQSSNELLAKLLDEEPVDDLEGKETSKDV
ncbi:MAG TPA: hypothetical protein QF762_02215 [Acidimicrobiales bacterium]|nr:hypothetical protein [Acidimicrobiales bacterium]